MKAAADRQRSPYLQMFQDRLQRQPGPTDISFQGHPTAQVAPPGGGKFLRPGLPPDLNVSVTLR